MDNINFRSQNDYTGQEKNQQGSHTVRNTILGSLGAGTVAAFASRAKGPSEDEITLKMLENDTVKKHIEDITNLKAETEKTLLDEYKMEKEELNLLWNKIYEKQELSNKDSEILKKYKLPEDASCNEVLSIINDKESQIITIKTPAAELEKQLAEIAKEEKEGAHEAIDILRKFIDNKASKEQLEVVAENFDISINEIELTNENLKKIVCEKFSLDPMKVTPQELEAAFVHKLVEISDGLFEKTNSFENLLEQANKIIKEDFENELSIKKAFDEKVNNIVIEKINPDILKNEALTSIKEDSTKALKNKRLMKWAAAGALAGGIVVGVISHFKNKSKNKTPELQ